MTPEPVRSGYRFWVPRALVGLRVALAPVAVWLAYIDAPRWVWLAQGAIAALSDIYDGKLARKWGSVTPGLRQSDSVADTIYAVGVLGAVYFAEPEAFATYWPAMLTVGALEALRYPLDWAKFGRGASYHHTSARLFGITLLPAVFLLMGFGLAWPMLAIALAIGLYSELEGFAISLALPRWTHDVPSFFAARRIARESTEAAS